MMGDKLGKHHPHPYKKHWLIESNHKPSLAPTQRQIHLPAQIKQFSKQTAGALQEDPHWAINFRQNNHDSQAIYFKWKETTLFHPPVTGQYRSGEHSS